MSSIAEFGMKGGFKPFLEDENPNYHAKFLFFVVARFITTIVLLFLKILNVVLLVYE